jgi:hypothetical protein
VKQMLLVAEDNTVMNVRGRYAMVSKVSAGFLSLPDGCSTILDVGHSGDLQMVSLIHADEGKTKKRSQEQ